MTDSIEIKAMQWMEPETIAEHLIPLLERYDVKNRGHGVIYVDHEQYNVRTAHMIVRDLSVSLGVSAQLVRTRLVELGLLNDVRSILPVQGEVARIVNRMPFRTDDASDEEHRELNEDYPDA